MQTSHGRHDRGRHRYCSSLCARQRRRDHIGRAKALAHNPLVAELAGMAENDVATLSHVFIQLHRPGGVADQLGKYSLALL
jgi:hypothetical protein